MAVGMGTAPVQKQTLVGCSGGRVGISSGQVKALLANSKACRFLL